MKKHVLYLWLPIYMTLLLLVFQVAPAQAQDPTMPGTFNPSPAQDYDFGDLVFPIPGFTTRKAEMRAAVRYPVDKKTGDIAAGRFPVLILLHGNHPTCLTTRVFTVVNAPFPNKVVTVTTVQNVPEFMWPCVVGGNVTAATRIDSYKGFDYLAQLLATQGFIVVSISANGINAAGSIPADPGLIGARAALIRAHLTVLTMFDATGSATFEGITKTFPKLKGHLDLSNVGLAGHSRGGETVVRYVAAFPADKRIKAVLAIAPTDGNGTTIGSIPQGVILPYSDGDVADLAGVHFFDRNRYQATFTAARHMFVVIGTNHNFYNSQWSPGATISQGAVDDWCTSYRSVVTAQTTTTVPVGKNQTLTTNSITQDTQNFLLPRAADPSVGCSDPNTPIGDRLTVTQQQQTGLGIVAAFFRAYMGTAQDNTNFMPLLKGDRKFPATAQGDSIFVSYQPPNAMPERLTVNTYLPVAGMPQVPLAQNTVGGVVNQKLLNPYDLCGMPTSCLAAGQPAAREPHRLFLKVLRAGWDSTNAVYYTELPQNSSDVSSYNAIQFRVGVIFTDKRNIKGQNQDFTVTLADANGNSDNFDLEGLEDSLNLQFPLFYPPGQATAYSDKKLGPVPHLTINMVRIPLTAFPDVDLTNLVRIYFRFTGPAKGSLVITDLLFAK